MRLPIFLLFLATLLTACASAISPFPKTEEHIVGSGDTVYSIAFENDLDYRDLAYWNDIDPPYKIYTGQMLVLHGYHPLARNGENRQAAAAADKPEKRESKIKTQPIAQSGGSSSIREVKPQAPATTPKPAAKKTQDKPVTPVVVPPAVVVPAPSKPVSVAKAEPATPANAETWSIPKYNTAWIWPVRGAILDNYSTTNKGIDIAGKVGEPVRATKAGKVVYAGEGLKGYGLLLIVKHDQNYLSAYGHNERLLVVQGETVKQGQPIATVGRGPENRAMLHFELRRNGKPVNPQSLLPK